MVIGHRIYGHGPIKVMAFHGWFGSAADWACMQPALDADLLTLVAVDQRGYGASMDTPGAFSVAEVASDGIAIADHLGWQRFHVLGHSMGAKVAQRTLIESRSRVLSVIALTGVPASGVPFDADTLQMFAAAAASDEVRAAIVSHSVSARLTPAWVRHIVANSRSVSSERAFRAYLETWACEDFSAAIAGQQVPVLVLIGEHDPALNEALMTSTFMRWYPNAELKIIPNSGHYPMWEAPVHTATLIQDYLQARHS